MKTIISGTFWVIFLIIAFFGVWINYEILQNTALIISMFFGLWFGHCIYNDIKELKK
jgi:4-hydroxybenzoate polyprenyltransferase